MRWLAGMFAAFSMFSRLPVPRREWSDATLRHILVCMPAVGLVIAFAVAAWGWLAYALDVGPFLRGAGFLLIPAAISGGIHLDGFCDVTDALASHGEREKKLAILKDPHIGAFAGIGLAGYCFLFAALAAELPDAPGAVVSFALLFVASRALCAIATLRLPPARRDGLAHTFQNAAAEDGLTPLTATVAATGVLLYLVAGWHGVIALAGMGASFLWCCRTALRRFGGYTGDLAGWSLQVGELAGLACFVFSLKIL